MNNKPAPRIFAAIPVINENKLIDRLVSCIRAQTYRNFSLVFCVNQPDEWWSVPGKKHICRNNAEMMKWLEKEKIPDTFIIDRSSLGHGWKGRKHGVGWARKTVMDAIVSRAGEEDIILSMDADITFSENYFQSIADSFNKYPEAVAMSVPYFHLPPKDPEAYRAILRYEIYMRAYSLNLWRIGSPYTFTALGSAMACPVGAYKAIGGLTPKMSGEDFYFLQKLRKYGSMIFWNPEKVYPEARFSDRVYFGTGPAMIRGNEGDWSSYPVFPYRFFDEVGETIALFPEFYPKIRTTRVVSFLREQFREEDPFQPLRENARDTAQFVRSCHEKLDGLRTLQYLKLREREEPSSDEDNLEAFLEKFYPVDWKEVKNKLSSPLDFSASSLEDLESIRTLLAKKEEEYQVISVPSLPGQLPPAR